MINISYKVDFDKCKGFRCKQGSILFNIRWSRSFCYVLTVCMIYYY